MLGRPFFPSAEGAMGERFGGPVCLEREQPVWAILLATPVSGFGGRQCVRLRPGRGHRLNRSRTYLCWEQSSVEGISSRPTGRLWPCGLIYRREHVSAGFPSGTVAFTKVVVPAEAARGTVSVRGRTSWWVRLDVNREDPVELALAADLQ